MSTTRALRLPAALTGSVAMLTAPESDALRLLERYYRARREGWPENGEYFTGAFFDEWNDQPIPQRASKFTAEDIVAVSYLSVDIPARAIVELLEFRAPELNECLARAVVECTDYATLKDVPLELTDPEIQGALPPDGRWAPLQLEHMLRAIRGIGQVSASKLIAHKLPHVYPVYDREVAALALPSRHYLHPLHRTLRETDLEEKLAALREAATIPANVPLLRVFDVVAWMEATHAASGTSPKV